MAMRITKNILACFLVVMFLLCIQSYGHAQENEEDAYLESMLFGDIPDVFSASKISQNMMKVPASMSVMTEHDIKRSGARTLTDLLKYMPGLYVTSSRSGFDLLKVRGMQDRYNNRVLLIIDGIPRRELFYGYKSISDLVPVENIKQLEVMRGPGSVLYGTDAFAGVISIFTKTAESSDKLQLDAGYGEFDSYKFNLGVGQKIGENLTMDLNARSFDSDGYDIDRGRDGYLSSETTDKNGYNLDLKLRYKDLLFIASHASLDYRYPWSRNDRTKDREERNTALGVKYSSDITDNIGIKFNLYKNIFEFLEDQTKYNVDGSINEYSKAIQENSVLGIDAYMIYQSLFSNQVVVGFTIEKEKTGQNEEMSRDPGQSFTVDQWVQNEAGETDFSLINYAFYLEDVWKINSQFELTTGLRYDNYEQYGDAINPRVGAVYTPIKKMTLKALYGEAFRGPTYKELFIKEFDGANNVVAASRANPALTAEEIKTLELEMSYAFNNNILSKIRYFHNDNKNAILSLGDNIPYDNLDGIKTNGVEVEVEYSYMKVSGFTNVTLTSGETSDGLDLQGYPDYQINSVLNYSPTEKIDTRIGVRFVSDRSRPADYHDGIDPSDADVGFLNAIDNLRSYFDAELSLTYNLNNNWSIAGYVYNLFDDKNYNPSYEPGEYWDLIHAGRSYFLNATYRIPN
jgi:outer membrane receptor for ferrienterochelin and colicin